MKRLLLLILICTLYFKVSAQTPTPDQGLTNVREKLVELALQNPDLEIADRQITIAKYQLKEAKGWWLNNISMSFNANDFTVKRMMGKTLPNGQLYPIYPLYNLGLNIPIGGIFSKPAATKAARERVAIAQASRSNAYRQIRASVLTAYENYLTSKELLTLQSQATEGAYNDFLQAKEKFRNGQISVDEYNNAAQQYHSQIVSRINSKHNFNLTKIQLETIIGVPLSQVLSEKDNVDATTTPSDSSAIVQ